MRKKVGATVNIDLGLLRRQLERRGRSVERYSMRMVVWYCTSDEIGALRLV